MPRKRILGPATAGQVLDYFRQSNLETTVVIYELVTATLKERQGPTAEAPKRRARKTGLPKEVES